MKTKPIITTLMLRAAMLLVTLLSTMTIGAKIVTLTNGTGEVTLQDGDVLTGTGGANTCVNIADGATVTLSGVDITAITSDRNHRWSGISCFGNAIIYLADGTTNNVKGGYFCSGIFVNPYHTLTIRGNGSLNANGNMRSSGIGGSELSNCGNIVIEGGNITAQGSDYGAGIGSGFNSSCGNISISGGIVNAKGNAYSAGIGSGYYGSCGNISISGGIVNAQGKNAGAGIGGSLYGSCGNITISGGIVTAQGHLFFAGIGSGYEGSCGDITIGEGITRVIAKTDNDFIPIGTNDDSGSNTDSSCGTITISSKLVDVTLDDTRTLYFEEPVEPFPNSNNQLYTLTSKRGELVLNADGTGLAAGQTRTNAPEEDKRFAIITYEGKQYIYSPKIKKYWRNDGTFVSRLPSPIIIDGYFADGDYKYMLFTKNEDGTPLTFNNNGNIVINGYNTPDEGNRWRIEAVADFDPTEALRLIHTIFLTPESGDVMIQDNIILTGTGGENTHVSIADGATVTLSGVDITQSSSKSWAGITCLGDAVIILEEGTTNNVKGGTRFSGIYVPQNKTLTIRGSGSLNVTGGRYGAGIGNGRNQNNCGNIIIEGGNITANGGNRGAGIGTGENCRCGYIIIRGGNVTATGGSMSAGIGGGENGVCGDITIGEGVTRVIATMGSGASDPVGIGYGGSCGNVSVSTKLVDVTLDKTRTLYFEEPVVPFPENNAKLCTLTSKRGGMVMNADGTGLAAGQTRTNAPEEDKRFAIITYEGRQYLYSPKARKYLRNDGTFVSQLGAPVIIDGYFADGDYKYMLFTKNEDGTPLTFNNDGNIVINGYNTPDEGNRWRIEAVADFEPREALAVAGLKLQDNSGNADIIAEYDNIQANVTLGGRTLYDDGTWNTLCLPFDVDDLSGTPLDGYTVMELDTVSANNGHKTGFDPSDITYYLNFKPATSIKAGQPYIVKGKTDLTIGSEADWNAFAANVANGTTYEGQVVNLTADITVKTMVGTSGNRFKGTFEGNGHTLTVSNLPATDQYCAPFRYVDGATFKNLHTAGNLAASDKYRSGLVGEIRNKVAISNCRSSVAINSSVSGDGTHGGFIGEVKSGGNVVIDNCLFDGSFTGPSTNCWGGFVGWSQGATTIRNSAFLPEGIYSLDSYGSKTFGRNNVTTENCYYSVALGDAQGTAVGDMTAGQLAEALGGGWQVNDGKVVPLMSSNMTIGSDAEWNAFAASVANGMTYEGQVVSLTADITVKTMAGTSDHRFKGTFDGNGHTLTVNLTASGQYCAPFRYVDGATFKNLHTAGTIAGSQKYQTGLVGETINDVTISNCWSSVTINSSVSGDGTHGGFIGEVKGGGNVVIDNCLFDGSIKGSTTDRCSGFVGWSQGVTKIKNSAFMPKELSVDKSGSATFGRSNNNNVMTYNCYYSVALGEAQGTALGRMTARQLAAALGGGWQVTEGMAVPVMGSVAAPVFYGVTIKNVTPATVMSADSTVCFTGSYSPVAIGANDHTKLYLGENNTLHYPYANMTINSFRAGFQVKASTMGDVNGDGDVSVADVASMVNHILGAGNDKFIEDRADLNDDGEITVNDVSVLVGMILTEIQDLNIVVFTGDTPITYGSGGRTAARVPKTILGDEE